ncbi:MAG: ROK family protein [Myxococcota bacterium]
MRIGIDLGGTRIKAGLVDEGGRVVRRVVEPVGERKEADAVVDALAEVVAGLREAAGVEVRALGVAAAGVLDRRRGVIRESPNFPAWRDFDLGRRLGERTSLPVALENDANAAVLGEARAGAGRGVESLFGLTLGTGVGGGIILDGRLWRGVRGMAGELGHVTVVPGGRPCGCGNRGCLEQYAGAVGIRQTLQEIGGGYEHLADDPGAPEISAERARAGDARMRELYEGVGHHLGQAIGGFVHTLDVMRVVLLGGIAASADLFMPALERSFRASTFRSMSQGVRIVAGDLGGDAGVVGAALGADEP